MKVCLFALAALLEWLWWGRPLHAWPGPAEYDRPDDSKVGTHTHLMQQTQNSQTNLINTLYFKTLLTLMTLVISLFFPSLPPSQFCGQPVQSRGAFCRHLSEGGMEGSQRVIEGNRRRMVVDVRLENKGENAYNARLNISYTPNLRFSSLRVKVRQNLQNCLKLCLNIFTFNQQIR